MIESIDDFIQRKKVDLKKKPNRSFPDISGKGSNSWVHEEVTFMPQSNLDKKILMIQRFRCVGRSGQHAYKGGARTGDLEYRFGYYMLGRKGNKRNKWTWGESAPFIPEKDLAKLLSLAKKEGTLI